MRLLQEYHMFTWSHKPEPKLLVGDKQTKDLIINMIYTRDKVSNLTKTKKPKKGSGRLGN